MPKELTHWILAGRAREALGGTPLARLLQDHSAPYLAGAVLPDTLMHLLTGRWSRQALALAAAFHDPAGDSYAPLVRAEQLHPSPLPPPVLACLLGVLSHMQADIHLHPFVYAHSRDMGEHYRLETSIDLHFLHCGRHPPVRKLAELLDPLTRQVMITACFLLFDQRHSLPAAAVERAIDLHARLQSLYAVPFWKVLVAGLGRLGIGRFSQQRHLFYPERDEIRLPTAPWTDPATGEKDLRNVDRIAEDTVLQTVELFRRIEERGLSFRNGLEGARGRNLLTGL